MESLSAIHALPSAPPPVYVRLLNLLNDPDVSVAQIASGIGTDPGLSAHVLRAVNSCFFGVREHVGSLLQAVALLGPRMLKLTALSYCLKRFVNNAAQAGFDAAEFWRCSVAVSAAASELSSATGRGASEEAFVAGLMSRLGVPLLFQRNRDAYLAVLEEVAATGRGLHEVERERLGVTHAETGARLLHAWKMPAAIADAVAAQYQPGACDNAEARPYAEVLHAAGLFKDCLAGSRVAESCRRMLNVCCEEFGIEFGVAQEIFRRVSDRRKEAAEMLDLYFEGELDPDAIIAEAQMHIARIQGEVDGIVVSARGPQDSPN